MAQYYSALCIKEHMLELESNLNRLCRFPSNDVAYIDSSYSNFVAEAKAGRYDNLTEEEYETLREGCILKHRRVAHDFDVIACKARELSSMISIFLSSYGAENMSTDISKAAFKKDAGMLFRDEYLQYLIIAKQIKGSEDSYESEDECDECDDCKCNCEECENCDCGNCDCDTNVSSCEFEENDECEGEYPDYDDFIPDDRKQVR